MDYNKNFEFNLYISNFLTDKLLSSLKNANAKHYVNLLQNNYIPLISKPSRISKRNTTITDKINTNNFLETDIKTSIIKSDISDHFPLFLIFKTTGNDKPSTETFIKRQI